MIAMRKMLQILSTVLLAGTTFAVDAQMTFDSNAPFVAVVETLPARQTPLVTMSDQSIFAFAPSMPNLSVAHPSYAGAWITESAATPQAQIDSVRLYAYALKTGVFQKVTARFRFWNAYQASADPVFFNSSEFDVDLTTCPCNFVAGNAYYVDVALPKPIFTEGTSLGFSEVWLGDPGDGVVAVSTDLVPAFDTTPGSETAGATIAGYGNVGRSPDDLNFAPADEPGGGRLGLVLNGTSMKLDQCTGAANFEDQLVEEFDDSTAFFQRWNADPNKGTFTVGLGYLALSAAGDATQFPYVASAAQVKLIPPNGNFEVRWLSMYTDVGTAGDGEMVVSRGTPLNGNSGDAYTGNSLRSWQDSGGFYVYANSSGVVQKIAGTSGTTLHDMEYCWVNGNVELWKDGVRIFGPMAQPAQRPDSLWFGNPVSGATGPWNSLTLYRVLVRGDQVTPSDRIFSNGFESPSND